MRISVIIPIYNAAPYLEKAVRSALSQPEVQEVLLIEDASQDQSLKICQHLAKEDSSVVLLQHPCKKNQGAGASRNLGLSNATHDYISFLDADDYYLPNRFATTRDIFTNTNADGVYEAVERVFLDQDSNKDYQLKYDDSKLITMESNIDPSKLFEHFFIGDRGWFSIDGLTIKREIIKKDHYFDESLKQTQDTDFILRLALAFQLFPGELKVPVTHALIHGNNRILNSQTSAFRFKLFEKWLHKSLDANWKRKVNRHILRGYLYNHPTIKAVEDQKLLRLFHKTNLAIWLFFKHPAMIKIIF